MQRQWSQHLILRPVYLFGSRKNYLAVTRLFFHFIRRTASCSWITTNPQGGYSVRRKHGSFVPPNGLITLAYVVIQGNQWTFLHAQCWSKSVCITRGFHHSLKYSDSAYSGCYKLLCTWSSYVTSVQWLAAFFSPAECLCYLQHS